MTRQVWAFILVVSAFYLWLIGQVPIQAFAHALHDDALFVRLAANIVQGNWLGPYDNATLVKGPFYPVFIAITAVSGLPILVTQGIAYLAAGIVLVLVISPYFERKWWLGVIFVAYAFNPIIYSLGSLRVMRAGIYVPLTVLVLALTIYALRQTNARMFERLLGPVGLGFAIGLFWLTREEGLWIIPAMLAAMTILICSGPNRFSRQRLRGHAGVCALVLAGAYGTVLSSGLANFRHYGVWDTVEFKQAEFVAAYDAVTRVKHPAATRYLPAPRKALNKLYAVSPAMAELKPHLDTPPGSRISNYGWIETGCESLGVSPCDGEFRSGYLLYSLREAAALAGYHSSALKAKAFYQRLSGEIADACNAKRLDCRPPRTTFIAPLTQAVAEDTTNWLFKSFGEVIRFSGAHVGQGKSTGSLLDLKVFKDVINSRIAQSKQGIIASGRIQNQSKKLTGLSIEGPIGRGHQQELQHSIRALPPSGSQINFSLLTDCVWAGCALVILTGDGGKFTIPTANLARRGTLTIADLTVEVSFAGQSEAGFILPSVRMSELALGILGAIADSYRMVAPILISLALVLFTVVFVHSLIKRELGVITQVNLLILILVFTRLFVISFMNAAAWQGLLYPLYFSPVYPLLLVFSFLAIADSGSHITRIFPGLVAWACRQTAAVKPK
jgi:hypothetical protein